MAEEGGRPRGAAQGGVGVGGGAGADRSLWLAEARRQVLRAREFPVLSFTLEVVFAHAAAATAAQAEARAAAEECA